MVNKKVIQKKKATKKRATKKSSKKASKKKTVKRATKKVTKATAKKANKTSKTTAKKASKTSKTTAKKASKTSKATAKKTTKATKATAKKTTKATKTTAKKTTKATKATAKKTTKTAKATAKKTTKAAKSAKKRPATSKKAAVKTALKRQKSPPRVESPEERQARLKDVLGSMREINFFASDSDECFERGCDNPATTEGYCRFHYIKSWKDIKKKQSVLGEGKLFSHVEGIATNFPIQIMESLVSDLASDKSFYNVLKEMSIEASEESFDDIATRAQMMLMFPSQPNRSNGPTMRSNF